jgi:hypothetical protein
LARSRSALVWLILLVGAGSGGIYVADRLILAPGREMERKLAERDTQIRALTERAQALEAAVRLLRHTERRARIVVLDQGNPVGEPREFTVTGDEVYVDTLVIKFEDEFVTAGDALKGQSLLLFRRIFGDRLRPVDAHVLDREGQMPQAYAAEKAPSAFERELWQQFWVLANDPAEARRRGIRALHGEAVSTKLRKGGVYAVTFRSTGELTIQLAP